jgi:branched-chain amino acid transport system permease protein
MATTSMTARARSGIAVAVSTVAVFVITQFVITDGTPIAVLFDALVLGMLQTLTVVGMILIYRSHRIISFVQPVLGVLGGIFTFNLAVLNEWPWLLALVCGVLMSALVGLVFQLVFVTRFFNAPRLVLTVLTIAAIPALIALIPQVSNLPIFPKAEDRDPNLFRNVDIPVPFEDWHFTIGDLPLRFGFAHVFSLVAVVLALIGLALFLRYTRVGTALRGAAENADRAKMLGISVQNLSMIAWTIAGTISGLGVILFNGTQEALGGGDPSDGLRLFVLPLAGAVVAGFRSYGIGAYSTVLLFVFRTAVDNRYPDYVALVDVGVFVLIVIAFLLHRRRGQRSEEVEASTWESMQEYRGVPAEMYTVPSLNYTRYIFIIIGVVGLLAVPWITSPGQTNNAGYLLCVAIAIMSLVVLTGWTGQVSLGQWAFVAVGAVVGGALTSRTGVPFWVAIIIVPIFTGAFALLMGLPALRIRGLFLAVATFGFAVAVERALFNERYFGWLLPERIDRPTLFLLDFEDNRSAYYLNLFALFLVVLLIVTLRRTRAGRLMIGARDNEANLQAFGVSPVRMRLSAFALSGFLCGFAGVLVAHHQRAATMADFTALQSFNIFVIAVVGGIGSVMGGLLAALYFSGLTLIPQDNPIIALIAGDLGTLAILYILPGGLASLVIGLRDSVLRIVAQRRQMIVPALFADYDPDTAGRNLVPLAEPIPGAGLNLMPDARRYATAESGLYGTLGRIEEAETKKHVDEDAAALGAAAKSFGGEEEAALAGETT